MSPRVAQTTAKIASVADSNCDGTAIREGDRDEDCATRESDRDEDCVTRESDRDDTRRFVKAIARRLRLARAIAMNAATRECDRDDTRFFRNESCWKTSMFISDDVARTECCKHEVLCADSCNSQALTKT